MCRPSPRRWLRSTRRSSRVAPGRCGGGTRPPSLGLVLGRRARRRRRRQEVNVDQVQADPDRRRRMRPLPAARRSSRQRRGRSTPFTTAPHFPPVVFPPSRRQRQSHRRLAADGVCRARVPYPSSTSRRSLPKVSAISAISPVATCTSAITLSFLGLRCTISHASHRPPFVNTA